MPFTTIEDMYQNTDFRLALVPSTTYEDNFKYSPDPLWQTIYKERLEPHLAEYDGSVSVTDMVDFIRDDFATAVFDGYIPFTLVSDICIQF